MLIMNLMVTELIVSAYGIPIAAVASAQKGWKMGETFCKASGFILTVLSEFFFIFYFSMVSHKYHRYELYGNPDCSFNIPLDVALRQRVVIMVGCSWVWSVSLSFPPLIGWGQYLPEGNGMR